MRGRGRGFRAVDAVGVDRWDGGQRRGGRLGWGGGEVGGAEMGDGEVGGCLVSLLKMESIESSSRKGEKSLGKGKAGSKQAS